MKHSRSAMGFAVTLVAVLALAACSGGDDDSVTKATTSATKTTGIPEAEAIELAQQAWLEEEPGFSFEDTRAHVAEIGATYDISWIPADNDGPGGEPHVVIDRVSGEALDVYRTK